MSMKPRRCGFKYIDDSKFK